MFSIHDPAREILAKIKEELLKYYHERCPQKRRKELELDVAMAWSAAQHISQLLTDPFAGQLHKTCIDELFAIVTFHPEEFPQLYQLLDRANFWVRCLEKVKEFY